jgi:hypothetical protein
MQEIRSYYYLRSHVCTKMFGCFLILRNSSWIFTVQEGTFFSVLILAANSPWYFFGEKEHNIPSQYSVPSESSANSWAWDLGPSLIIPQLSLPLSLPYSISGPFALVKSDVLPDVPLALQLFLSIPWIIHPILILLFEYLLLVSHKYHSGCALHNKLWPGQA